MTALSVPLDIVTRKDASRNRVYPIANGETVYYGGYYAVNAAGYLTEMADTAGNTPVGLIVGFDAGATDAGGAQPLSVAGNTAGTPVPTAIVDCGEKHVNDVPIAGLSAQLDIHTPIYLGSDNWATDFTATPTANIPSVGFAIKRNSATSFEIFLYSQAQMRLGAAGVASPHYWDLVLDTGAIESQTSANVARYIAPTDAILLSSGWTPGSFDTGYTSGSVTLTIRKNSTNVSGGVMTVAFGGLNGAGDLDAWTSGTAITNTSGAARIVKGDLIRLVKSAASGLSAITAPVPFTVHLAVVALPSS